ncbi:MAG: glycosyltransferase [Candidatus Bathyarchaeia archaeon]
MDKFTVLMTTMEYDVIKVGGLSAALTSLANAMKKYAKVSIILPKSSFKLPWKKLEENQYPNVKMEVFDHNGVKVYTLSNKILDEKEVYPEPANEKAIRKIDEFCRCLCEVVSEINFDIVHMHDFFAYKAMDKFKEMGKPIILTIHRLHREYPNWFAGERLALEKADYITVVGESYYNEDEKELFEKYKDKVTCVFNGIDTEFWNVQESSYPNISRNERRKIILQKYGLSDGVFYVYVGRFDPVQKGVDILLNASAQFLKNENVRMIIVGVGDKKLETSSKELEAKYPSKLKVINKLLPKEEVRDLYSSADFALIPSIFEPFGLVQLEAMSCECIPIGSRTGGIKDTVISYEDNKQEATGFLVERGNPKALLNTMQMALTLYKENPEVIEKMRKNGRERCEKIFQWEISSRRYLDIYKKLLKSSKKGV